MEWKEIQTRLAAIGVFNFESVDEFLNWRKWENDCIKTELLIQKALSDDNCIS